MQDLAKINTDLEKAAETQARSSTKLTESQSELEAVVARQVEVKTELKEANSQVSRTW